MVSSGEMMFQNVLCVGLAGSCKLSVYRDSVLEDLFYCLYFTLIFCFVLVYHLLRLDISVWGCFSSLPNLRLHKLFCFFLWTQLLVCFLFVIFFSRFCNSFYLMVLHYVVSSLLCASHSLSASYACLEPAKYWRWSLLRKWIAAKSYLLFSQNTPY